MNSHQTTMLLAAAWLIALTPLAFAETDVQPTPEVKAAGPKPSGTRRPDKARSKHIATRRPAVEAPQPDAEQTQRAAERAASLERRRKAFFANKPDAGEPAGDASSAPVGVTLGGSGGLTPEMGLKF